MVKNKKYSKWMFIFFPAIAMMQGWGLRGHIGGGPFGAMIPGVMVALTICLLLEMPATLTSVIVVFGVGDWPRRRNDLWSNSKFFEKSGHSLVGDFGDYC